MAVSSDLNSQGAKMANERKTENIVRNHFESAATRYRKLSGCYVAIEEQKSEDPKIQKLLKRASKTGTGKGRPEFIISFSNKDILVVVECKADTKYHDSSSHDKYDTYAVDGVLLYSSFLSKDFDVIAIAVSGQDEDDMLIDTFVQVKGQSPKNKEVHRLLEFNDLLKLVTQDTDKGIADHAKLKEYSKALNQRLRDVFEIEEIYRPLIASAILLSLEDSGFCKSYKSKQTPQELATLILTTVKERLQRDNVGQPKKNTMMQTFSFLETNVKIIHDRNKDGSPNTHLRDLIDETETNIKPFSDDYRYHDILGTFYIDFLKYANGDGGLGVVLTPFHITELFCELAEVTKDSVVIDNCCGTGGFLIAAMKKMEQDVGEDSTKLQQIHERQLIGIESNSKMFCLACSNMMFKGDGKSNIHQQECFQIEQKQIGNLKPTVAFLNPPYSKKNGHKELEFIRNALSFLEPNGICVAILPQSCAGNTKPQHLPVKRKILEEHTLKAVMSMPDDLFHDSNVSTVTCVMVFEAGKPHNKNIKTWFGYWKDDGFIKYRPQGRVDYYKKYEDCIKKEWLSGYFDREEKSGVSVLQSVTYEDEWLVEPYLKTRFEDLCDTDFETTLLHYSTFLFYNKLISNASRASRANATESHDFSRWEPFRLRDLFKVKGSVTSDKKQLESNHKNEDVSYPYVTTQTANNGVHSFYDFHTEQGNVLTIDSAVRGYCAYQPLNFSASDHVEVLTPTTFNMNVYRGLFLATVINKEQYRYSYGRKFNQERIRNTIVELPSTGGGG